MRGINMSSVVCPSARFLKELSTDIPEIFLDFFDDLQNSNLCPCSTFVPRAEREIVKIWTLSDS